MRQKISLADHPKGVILPIFPRCGLLRGVPPADFESSKSWVAHEQSDVDRIVQKLGVKSIRIARIHQDSFARMLAEIAHSFAVAQKGVDNLTPFLNNIIVGIDRNFGYYIGCETSEYRSSTLVIDKIDEDFHIHGLTEKFTDVTHVDGRCAKLFLVEIQLFSWLGTPKYLVAVGIV
jgi:hypothetical protein